MIEVTTNYAVFLAIFLMVLSFRVIDLRGSPVTGFLHKKDRVVKTETLKRAIRGHANFIEYTPLFLLLLLIAEMNGHATAILHLAACSFTLGRLIHGIGFSFMPPRLPMRIGGMVFTFTGFFILIGSHMAQ